MNVTFSVSPEEMVEIMKYRYSYECDFLCESRGNGGDHEIQVQL